MADPVDHALVIVPAAAVMEVLDSAVTAGIRSATVYASAMGEGHDANSLARGVALSALLARSSLTINGPNCMGGNDLHARYCGYPNRDLARIAPGGVALVSQSGGTLQFLAQAAAARGVKFSSMFSSGNELDLDLADFVNHLVDDVNTRIIALFIEGVRRPAMFMTACARALEAGKPVVVIKTGKSQRSRDAAQSHTGAVAGDWEAFNAMCRRYGVIRCDTLDDMVETLLALQPGRWPKGRRVGWVTTSGGTVDLLHDLLEDIGGVETPAFSQATLEALRPLVPAESEPCNPLDAGIPSSDVNAATMCRAVAADPAVDILAWAAVLPSGRKQPDASVLATIAASTDKPVIAFGRMNYSVAPGAAQFQDQIGIPYLQGLPETVRALGAMAFFAKRAGRRIPALPPASVRSDDVIGPDRDVVLARYGVTPVASVTARDATAAGLAAEQLGGSVVLKLVSPQVSHKTEVGGVALGLVGKEAVERAAHDMVERLAVHAPHAVVAGFDVQEMVSGVEVLVGARSDPQFGPLLVLGAGGVFVELTRDLAFALLPVDEDEVRQMLSEIRLSRLLAGWRGAPRADIEALVRAVCGLSDLFLARRDHIADIEINPLIVRPEGQGVRAVDVRIVPTVGSGKATA
jgi:acyl-CoA synthetase (NDP forming)